MFCTKCGKELINPGKFCVACGAPLTALPAQAPVNPNTVLYDGNCMWTTGGVFYSNCYMTVTYEKIMLFKNKRAKERGEQPMVTIFCNTIRAIRMTGNDRREIAEFPLSVCYAGDPQRLPESGEIPQSPVVPVLI